MKPIIDKLKRQLAGKWQGDGFAKYSTIDDTAYSEQLEFIPDPFKDAIFFNQKTWYKNNTEKNGHTVFWDTGFIILREDKLLLHSVQIGGRMEAYELTAQLGENYTFDSVAITQDPKAIRSQRVFTLADDQIHYALNMATHQAEYQNHLLADLKRKQ